MAPSSAPEERLGSEARRTAGRMNLRSRPLSDAARELVQSLLDGVVLPRWPEGKQVRPSSLEATSRALGALLADLLKLEAEGRAGARGAMRETFTGLSFGLNIFTRVRDALEAAGLLQVHLGKQQLIQFKNRNTGQLAKPVSQGGQVSRYRLTLAGLDWVRAAGVELQDWGHHWGRDPKSVPSSAVAASKAPLVVLRTKAARSGGERATGRDLPVDEADPKVAAIIQDLKDHNEFVLAAPVGGIVFRGVRRVFNDGDQPGFDWQWGGGFYSQPDGEAYERLDGPTRRSAITIGGERVGEADLTAAQLSLLYALAGVPLEPAVNDPYELDGFNRELVKAWTTKALGSASPAYRQWSGTARAHYAEIAPGRTLSRDHPIGEVRRAALQHHPVLEHLGQPGLGALDLQFHQSEVIRKAMAALRKEGIASLSVHDSLVAPIGALRTAVEALRVAFTAHIEEVTGDACSVAPAVRLKGP